MEIPIASLIGMLGKAQSQGIGVFAPLMMQAMPNAVRVLVVQRLAALAAERAAVLSRCAGDALAIAMAAKQDVPEQHLAQLELAIVGLTEPVAAFPTLAVPVGPEDLVSVYSAALAAVLKDSQGGAQGNAQGVRVG